MPTILHDYIMFQNYIVQNKSASGADPVGKYGADLSAAPLTVTAGREEDVDFVKPFAHLGLTALLQKPQKRQGDDWPYDFDILKPLSAQVWAGAIIASLLVSISRKSMGWALGGRVVLGGCWCYLTNQLSLQLHLD